MIRFRLRKAAIAVAIALFGVRAAPAQLVPGLPVPSTTENPPAVSPGPVPLEEPVLSAADIPSRALVVQSRLRAIRSEARPRGAILQIERDLARFLERFEQDRVSPALAVGPDSSAGQLEAVASLWTAVLDQTRDFDSVLLKRTQTLQGLVNELRQMSSLWTRTREAAREDPLPPAQAERVQVTLAAIAEVETQVAARRDEVLRLADQALEVQLAARDSLDTIDDLRREQRRGLFETNAPPLLKAFQAEQGRGGLRAEAREALQRHGFNLRMAANHYASRIPWHAAILVGLVAVLEWLRRRSRRWYKDDPALDAAFRIFEHPVASATLVALLLSGFLYPRAPSSLFAITGLFALLSTLTILPGLLPKGLRASLYLLGGLYFGTQLITLTRTNSAFERVLVVVLAVLTIAILTRLLSTIRRGRVRILTGTWRTAIPVGSALGVLVVTVAIVANLIGKASLSAFLTVATIRSAFVAVFLFVVGLVLDGLWIGLLRSPVAQRLRAVRLHGKRLRDLGLRAIHIGLPILWAFGTVQMFELAEPLANRVRRVLSASLEIRNLHLSLGMVVSFVLVLWAAMLLSRVLRFFLDEDILPRLPLGRGVPRAISLTLHYVLLLFGFFAALAAAGVEFSQFAILGGAFGIGLAFGMQNIINNFVSGLILLYERPIQVGDSIEMGTMMGNVERIGIRSSTVRTWDGAEIIVPNADLIAKEVTNWTLTDRIRRIDVPVGVAYGTDPEPVLKLLEETGARHEEVLVDPPPSALFVGFGDSSLNFVLRVWTGRFENWVRIKSDLHVAIAHAFAKHGLEIPFPQRDVHVRTVAAGVPEPPEDGIPRLR